MKPEKRLAYSVAEFMDLTGLSRPFVYKAIKEGTIPCIRIGNGKETTGRILISKLVVNEWLNTGVFPQKNKKDER